MSVEQRVKEKLGEKPRFKVVTTGTLTGIPLETALNHVEGYRPIVMTTHEDPRIAGVIYTCIMERVKEKK